jgi:hypothetical protein
MGYEKGKDGKEIYNANHNFKEKYKGNALIDAIQLKSSNNSDRVFLYVNTTGEESGQIQKLQNAWISLHKKDPVLSRHLFNYCFFRGGIGFSPKTFMSLVPNYVKERIKTVKDGKTISYLDVYRNLENSKVGDIIDQFIQNNWNDNSLVPWKGNKDSHFEYSSDGSTLRAIYAEDKAAVEGVTYMKTSKDKVAYLWKFIAEEGDNFVFQRLKPFGGNSEFLEIHKTDTKTPPRPLENTTEVKVDEYASTEQDAQITDEIPVGDNNQVVPKSEEVKEASKFASMLYRRMSSNNPNLKTEDVDAKMQDIKNNFDLYKNFVRNVLKENNIDTDRDNVKEEFDKLC